MDGKLRFAAHARMRCIYYVGIYVHMCRASITRARKISRTQIKKGNVRLEKQAMEVARFVNHEEKELQIRSPKGKNTGTRATCMVNRRSGKGRFSYYLNASICSALYVIQVLDGS